MDYNSLTRIYTLENYNGDSFILRLHDNGVKKCRSVTPTKTSERITQPITVSSLKYCFVNLIFRWML